MSDDLCRIVYLETDDALREVIALSLRKFGGFDATGFADATNCLTAIQTHVPAVIMLDAVRPVIPEAKMLQMIRSDPATRKTPIILTTAYTRMHQVRRYKALGADGIIPKPLNPFSLPETIRDICAEVASENAAADRWTWGSRRGTPRNVVEG